MFVLFSLVSYSFGQYRHEGFEKSVPDTNSSMAFWVILWAFSFVKKRFPEGTFLSNPDNTILMIGKSCWWHSFWLLKNESCFHLGVMVTMATLTVVGCVTLYPHNFIPPIFHPHIFIPDFTSSWKLLSENIFWNIKNDHK